MDFLLQAFQGENNVDDTKRIQKYTFGQDLVMLSGDVVSSVNFRLAKDGIAAVRNGMTVKNAVTNGGVIWFNKKGDVALFVEGTQLKLLNSDYSDTLLYSGLTAGADMAFEEHNRKVFMGNGHEMLKYENGAVSAWADTTQDAAEFDPDQRIYQGLPNSDIIHSYYARMYAATGRYVGYSEITSSGPVPERFRKSAKLVAWEDVKGLSSDDNCFYVHTANWTFPFVGRDPESYTQMEPVNIGAIKHYPGMLRNDQGASIWMSRQGWAMGVGGQVQYEDHSNFRLNLSENAKCYTGYDPIHREVICNVRDSA